MTRDQVLHRRCLPPSVFLESLVLVGTRSHKPLPSFVFDIASHGQGCVKRCSLRQWKMIGHGFHFVFSCHSHLRFCKGSSIGDSLEIGVMHHVRSSRVDLAQVSSRALSEIGVASKTLVHFSVPNRWTALSSARFVRSGAVPLASEGVFLALMFVSGPARTTYVLCSSILTKLLYHGP